MHDQKEYKTIKKERFSFINPSPLLGGKLSNLFLLVKRHHVSFKFWPKLILPFIISTLTLAFRIIDRVRYKLSGFNTKLSPVFIIGHWRSGTTFLQNLICQDPQFGYLTTYQAVFPEMMSVSPLLKRILSPFMAKKRPGDDVDMHFDYPQEDEFAMNNLTVHSFYHFMYFPRDYKKLYNAYVRFMGPEKYKRTWMKTYTHLLEKIAWSTGKSKIVLKNPVNTGRINVILEMYPNAKFIFIHRNPLNVFQSTRKFFKILFENLQLQNVDSNMREKLILDVYEKITKDYIDQRKNIPEAQLVEVKFESLVKTPLKTIKEIYSQLSLENYEKAEANISEYLSSLSKDKSDNYSINKEASDIVKKKWAFAFDEWSYT